MRTPRLGQLLLSLRALNERNELEEFERGLLKELEFIESISGSPPFTEALLSRMIPKPPPYIRVRST